MRKKLLVLGVAFLFCVSAYFIYLNRPPEMPDIIISSDLWEGSWSSDKTKAHGGFTVNFRERSEIFSGDIRITGSSVTKGGDIKGTIKGNKIEFGLVKDKRGQLKYIGTISGNTMSGIWQIPVIKDQGLWQATKSQARDSSG